jgi:hypothetical protein
MIQRPTAISLLVCEQVIVEENTRNVTLVNCYRRLHLREFPAFPKRMVIHAILTDGLGRGTIRLAVTRLDTLEDIYAHDIDATFSDPLQEVRLLFRPSSLLSFPEAGRYEISLLMEGQSIAHRVLEVSAAEELL